MIRGVKMDTKHRILDEALTLFSQKGYTNVFVSEIAERVGIKAPSLYKHYKNKQAIFDAIIEEMNIRYKKQADSMNLNGINPLKDIEMYSNISEDSLIEMGKNLFLYFLHDDYTSRFRKILTIEQFNNKDFAKLYSCQYVDEPLSYQKTLFKLLVANGNLMACDLDIMTLQFFSPMYLLLTLCDREPEREEEALIVLEKHIQQFILIYGETKE